MVHLKRLILATLIIVYTLTVQAQPGTIITNIQLVDGTGRPSKPASVRIVGNKIVAIGALKPNKMDQVIDGKGKILAPGFIDSHSHHFGDLNKNRQGLSTSSQGITTIVIGQDGNSYPMDSLINWMSVNPVVSNVASYTGQSSLREMTMGENDLYRNIKRRHRNRPMPRLRFFLEYKENLF